ncbi:MAG TPA: aldehyde dehydrogenase family protein [Actinocrinis sp.]|nr:aldehyde dehydrogenase family protein [Actinocrinis sp.]
MDARGGIAHCPVSPDLPESLLIGGVWRAARDGRTRTVAGPVAEAGPARVAEAGPRDTRDAVAAARLAFDEGPWPRLPGRERAQILYDAADLVEESGARLARLQAVDMGKPVRFGEGDDVPFAAMALRFFAAMASQQNRGQSPPSVGGSALRQPRGVVGAACAFHHPLAMAAAIVAPALAMGDTVVLKPPTAAPRAVLEFARLCQEAGLPPGALNVVTGGRSTGCAMASNRGVDLVSFLGSVPQGRQLATACATQFVPMDLDLGLPNAHIVFEDAHLEHAAWQTARSLLPGRAEFRASGVRVLVHEQVYPEFLERLSTHLRSLVPGDPRDPATRLGPLAGDAERAGLEGFLGHGRTVGARLLPLGADDAPAAGPGPADLRADLLVPARLVQVPLLAAGAVAPVPDIFAPLALLTVFRETADAVAAVNRDSGTHACSLYTVDVGRAAAVAEVLRAQSCWIKAARPGGDLTDPLADEDADDSAPLREFGLDSALPFTRHKDVRVDLPY